MIVDENEVAVKKFKMFAEKAKNERDVIDLCRKYLKHKGIDVDTPLESYFAPKLPEKIYVGMKDIVRVQGQFILDGYDMSKNQTSQEVAYAQKYVVDNIIHELVKSNLIDFQSYRKMDTYQTVVRGTLHAWKDPNAK